MRSAYPVLLGLGVLDALGYGMIAPVVPAIGRETGAGPAVIGILVTCFGLGQLVGYPLAGRAVQRRGAAFVLGFALALIALGDLGFVAGDDLGLFLAARLVQGIGAGGLWMGITFGMLERFPGEEYRRLTSLLGAYAIGGVAGPAFGAIGGIRGPFLAHLGAVGLGAAALALVGPRRVRTAPGSDRAALRSNAFVVASAGVLLVSLALGALEGPLALHFGSRLGQSQVGALYVGAALAVGVTAVAAGRASARPALALGAIVLAPALALAGATASVPFWVAAVALAAVGLGLAEAGSLGVLLEVVSVERMVLAMVIWSQAWGVGYLVGPAASGAAAQALGFGGVALVPLAIALVVLAGLASPARAIARPASGRER